MDHKKTLIDVLYNMMKQDLNNKSEYTSTIYELLEDYPITSTYACKVLLSYAGNSSTSTVFEDYIRNKVNTK